MLPEATVNCQAGPQSSALVFHMQYPTHTTPTSDNDAN